MVAIFVIFLHFDGTVTTSLVRDLGGPLEMAEGAGGPPTVKYTQSEGAGKPRRSGNGAEKPGKAKNVNTKFRKFKIFDEIPFHGSQIDSLQIEFFRVLLTWRFVKKQ